MNYFTSAKFSPLVADVVFFVVRLFAGFAMLTHGYPKLEQLMSGDEIQFFDFLGLGARNSLILVVFSEFVCAIFLILGLFTRWAAFFLAFTMFVAAFIVHGTDSFEKREASLLYLSLFLIFLLFDTGRFSIDAMISRKKKYHVNW